MAVRRGDRYIVNGQKVWISRAQVAHKIMLLARNTPIEEVTRPTHGLSLFFTDFDRQKIEVREINKLGRNAVDSNQSFIDGLEIAVDDRIGEEGRGFEYILHGLNPDRVRLTAEATSIGRVALRRAAQYAGERILFDRPIGKNPGIQHPLAERWIDLEASTLLYQRAAWLYDRDMPRGAEANATKFFCVEA
jgi:acyl-CoA dehydrogenase